MEISQAEKYFKCGFFLNMILKLYITTKLGFNILGCKESNLPVCLADYSWNACTLQILYCYLTIAMWGKLLHSLGSTSSLRCSKFSVGKKAILRMGDNIKAQFPFIRLGSLSHSDVSSSASKPPQLRINVYKTQYLDFSCGCAESAQELGFNDAHRFNAEIDIFHLK